MKKVDSYIMKRQKEEKGFKEKYSLIQQKVEIAKYIIKFRLKNNLSQNELAKQMNISQQYISKIEEGDFANLETIEKVLIHIGYCLRLNVVTLERHKKVA